MGDFQEPQGATLGAVILFLLITSLARGTIARVLTRSVEM